MFAVLPSTAQQVTSPVSLWEVALHCGSSPACPGGPRCSSADHRQFHQTPASTNDQDNREISLLSCGSTDRNMNLIWAAGMTELPPCWSVRERLRSLTRSVSLLTSLLREIYGHPPLEMDQCPNVFCSRDKSWVLETSPRSPTLPRSCSVSLRCHPIPWPVCASCALPCPTAVSINPNLLNFQEWFCWRDWARSPHLHACLFPSPSNRFSYFLKPGWLTLPLPATPLPSSLAPHHLLTNLLESIMGWLALIYLDWNSPLLLPPWNTWVLNTAAPG